jgi:HAMP domain-containing protein
MSLSVKINVLVATCLLLGLIFVRQVHVAQTTTQSELAKLQQAEALFQAMESVRDYQQQELLPLLNQLNDGFMPQKNPSYTTMRIMADLHEQASDISYQVAIEGAGLELYQANVWQQQLIRRFRQNPETPLITDQLTDANGGFFIYAKPIIADAEVIGAKVVRLNNQRFSNSLADSQQRFTLILAGVFLLVMLIIQVLLHVLIIKPIRQMSVQADQVSRGERDQFEVSSTGQDEVSQLAQSFSRLQRSLKAAMSLLSERS